MVEHPRWTKADARSLARKMVDFMNTLTPGEQALLEDKIRRTMPGGEVQGYEWILESQDAPEGAEHRFEVWVWED